MIKPIYFFTSSAEANTPCSYLFRILNFKFTKTHFYPLGNNNIPMSVTDSIFRKFFVDLCEQDIPIELIVKMSKEWSNQRDVLSQTIKEFLEELYENEN